VELDKETDHLKVIMRNGLHLCQVKEKSDH
jgi:hypothetical protein